MTNSLNLVFSKIESFPFILNIFYVFIVYRLQVESESHTFYRNVVRKTGQTWQQDLHEFPDKAGPLQELFFVKPGSGIYGLWKISAKYTLIVTHAIFQHLLGVAENFKYLKGSEFLIYLFCAKPCKAFAIAVGIVHKGISKFFAQFHYEISSSTIWRRRFVYF